MMLIAREEFTILKGCTKGTLMAELRSRLGASMAVPERGISMGRKSAWVNFFLGLLMF